MPKVIKFEAQLPPKRKTDDGDRRLDLFNALARPGNWASELKLLPGRKLSWTMTVPDSAIAAEPIQDTIDQVGYWGSDTVGPSSRKAKLWFGFEGKDLQGPVICPGTF